MWYVTILPHRAQVFVSETFNLISKGDDFLEVRINKEILAYQESIFFGLSLRQFLCSLLAVLAAVIVYFGIHRLAGSYEVGWLCVLAAFPFAFLGFFRYNGMTAERFLLAFFRSNFRYPKCLVFRSENLYAKALVDSSVKEALRLD